MSLSLGIDTTLSSARDWLQSHLRKGAVCPCCNQQAKLYERSINRKMVKSLIKLYALSLLEERWVHAREVTDGSGDFAKLRYWGLIQEKPNEESSKRTSGYWKLTWLGKEFVEKKAEVSKYARVFNSEFYGFTGPKVTIEQCYRERFDLQQLMSRSS